MRLRLPLLAVALAAAAAGLSLAAPHAERPALAHEAPAPLGPTVALLTTLHGAAYSSLSLVRPGEAAAPPPVARFDHLEGAMVKGAVIPGTSAVVAVADTLAVRDPSFAASLFRVQPHRPAERLCDRLVHGSRPLVTPSSRVFVSRGTAGAEPSAAPKLALREDALSIDEIDPSTGHARIVHTFSGYLAFLAGAYGTEILVYRVGASGADLVAVDADTGGVRILAKLLPFARDFSVDSSSGTVVFEERDEKDSRTWVVDRLDLASGARTRLYSASALPLAPSVWPGGGVAVNLDGRQGLSLLGSGNIHAPLGDGVDQIQAFSSDKGWAAALHTQPSTLPVPFAIEIATGRAAVIPHLPGARVTVAGFVGGAQ